MAPLFALLLHAQDTVAQIPYSCGQMETRKKPYGVVELRVNCDYVKKGGSISVLEYKGKVQHGISIHFDSLWRQRDSSFYVNGKKNGLLIFWDTLGNIVGRESFRNGKNVGKREHYFAPGKPSLIKHYNSKGKEEGPWMEWWSNGNPKGDLIAKNGEIISGTEFYPDGQPRIHFISKYDPGNKSPFTNKYIQGETWTPNGKSTGRIINGNGEWTHFSAVPDRVTGHYAVFREVYKDSIMIKGEKLDSAEVAQWLK